MGFGTRRRGFLGQDFVILLLSFMFSKEGTCFLILNPPSLAKLGGWSFLLRLDRVDPNLQLRNEWSTARQRMSIGVEFGSGSDSAVKEEGRRRWEVKRAGETNIRKIEYRSRRSGEDLRRNVMGDTHGKIVRKVSLCLSLYVSFSPLSLYMSRWSCVSICLFACLCMRAKVENWNRAKREKGMEGGG